MRRRTVRALLAAAVLAATLFVSVMTAMTTTVAAQDELVVTTTTGQVPGFGHIIPQPNSGRPPRDATDRGGWAQYAVLGGIVGGMAVIVGLVVRESRRKRGGPRTDQGVATSTRSEPVADRSANRPDSSARQ